MPRPRISLCALFAVALLAGCSNHATSPSTTQAAPVAVPADGRCHAEGAEYAVNQKASADLLEQARQRSGAQMARVLGPHDMITMEYRGERLNFNTDEQGTVVRVNCG